VMQAFTCCFGSLFLGLERNCVNAMDILLFLPKIPRGYFHAQVPSEKYRSFSMSKETG